MRVLFRTIKTKHKNWTAFADELKKELDETAKPDLLKYFECIVASWKHKPQFRAMKRTREGGLSVYVYPMGENAKYWQWITQGTPKRDIVPRADNPHGLLFFKAPYSPKTSRGGHYNGPGTYGNEWIVAKKVENHEIKAREFEKHIARWYKSEFERNMRNAIKRAARR